MLNPEQDTKANLWELIKFGPRSWGHVPDRVRPDEGRQKRAVAGIQNVLNYVFSKLRKECKKISFFLESSERFSLEARDEKLVVTFLSNNYGANKRIIYSPVCITFSTEQTKESSDGSKKCRDITYLIPNKHEQNFKLLYEQISKSESNNRECRFNGTEWMSLSNLKGRIKQNLLQVTTGPNQSNRCKGVQIVSRIIKEFKDFIKVPKGVAVDESLYSVRGGV